MYLDETFIKIYNLNIEDAIKEYSLFLKLKLDDWFVNNPKDDLYYNKLKPHFYNFFIDYFNLRLEMIFSNQILYEGGNVPDGIAVRSEVSKNSFFFEHLNKTIILDKDQCLIFPYSENYNIKDAENYYAVSFSQQQ